MKRHGGEYLDAATLEALDKADRRAARRLLSNKRKGNRQGGNGRKARGHKGKWRR